MEKFYPYAFKQASLKFPEEIKGLISIIIPIYNVKELYFREALDSVIAQTFENWEAILVDDGSTDEAVEKVCSEYAEKDSRFKCIRKSNEGTLLARKTGLENARGEFIANLDNDDAYNSRFLEKMLAKIKEGDYDFVWCNFKDKICSKLNAEFGQSKLENCRRHKAFGGSTWNKLIKRSIYAKVLFPQAHVVGGEDYIQLLQVIYQSERAGYIPDELYSYRVCVSASNSKCASLRRHYASASRCAVIIYLLMEQLFNAGEAERHPTFIMYFIYYFLLSRKELALYEIEYMENFVPAFLRGVEKSKNIKFFDRMRYILASKGFALPLKIPYRLKRGLF